jgi:diguanylate cyclase (GGDEF)-like protein/PAS domain S-box-containing protein
MWATLKAGKEWQGEFINRKRDGTIYYESATIAPIANPAGVITHYVAVKEDITERKRLESELRTTDLRMRSLFEQTHDAVFIMDLTGQFLDANLHALEILGYQRAEILQLSLLDISAEPEKTALVISRLVAGEIIPLYERRFRKKSGQVFPGEVNIELVKDEGKEPLHIQCNIRDISRRKQAEDALNHANELLRQRVAEVEALHEEVREQSLHDPLTGLYNRRYLADTLNREVTRAENDHVEVSLILADIDFFKVINDTYGHAVGDQFLVEISRNLTQCARKSDFICRFGGEEFLLILPSTGREAAMKRAEQMRQHCAKIDLPYDGQNLHVTVSFGVATYPRHAATAEELIVRADKAMYLSKHTGRNRVTASDDVKVAQNDQAAVSKEPG